MLHLTRLACETGRCFARLDARQSVDIKEPAMQFAVMWEGLRCVQVHYGRTEEPPSCGMLVEPISMEHSVVTFPCLRGSPREPANPVIEPDSQPDNANDGVEEGLKDARYGEYNRPWSDLAQEGLGRGPLSPFLVRFGNGSCWWAFLTAQVDSALAMVSVLSRAFAQEPLTLINP